MGIVSKTGTATTPGLVPGDRGALTGLSAALPGSKACGTAGCGGSIRVPPHTASPLLDQSEQSCPAIAFQYAVQGLGVTNSKHVVVLLLGPSPWPSQLYISEQLQPSVEER